MLGRRGPGFLRRLASSSRSLPSRRPPGAPALIAWQDKERLCLPSGAAAPCLQESRRWLAYNRRRGIPLNDDDAEEMPLGDHYVNKDPSQIKLPPGIDTEGMSLEEMESLAEGLRLIEAQKKTKKPPKKAAVKLDLRYLRAASSDPADHHPQAKGFRMGAIYTIPDNEYSQYFSGIRRKERLPLESGIHRALGQRFLMIRPPAVEILGHLRAFTEGGKFPKAAEAEALRDQWAKSGRTLTIAMKAKAAEDEEVVMPAAAEEEMEEQEAAQAAAAGGKEEEEQKDEEEEEDDDYDLFGSEEDEEGGGRGPKVAEEESDTPRLKDVDIYGTLKLLAVDDNLVHPEQTYELPLTPPPKQQGGDKKTVFLLTGPRGTGKSATLCHVVHYARKHGWIVLYVPSAREYTHEGQYIKPSSHFKGYFDTPDLCQLTLQQVGQAHAHQLSQLPIQDPQVLRRAGLSKGSTLVDLVAVGLENAKVASSVLVDLKTEVEKQKDFPVLVAIDEYSEWFRPSDYYYARRKIEAQHLAAVRVFRDMLPHSGEGKGLHHDHVMVVAARSERYPKNKEATFGKDKKKKVEPLPSKLGYEVPVGRYSNEEFDGMYKYLAEGGIWGDHATTALGDPQEGDKIIKHARMVTGANPEVLEQDAIALQDRYFAPQNKVGKASQFAPKGDMLYSDFVVSFKNRGGQGGEGGPAVVEQAAAAPWGAQAEQGEEQQKQVVEGGGGHQ